MPDEDVAVAEPDIIESEAPAIPTPTEAVPVPEQEPSVEEESETQETEDEAPGTDQLLDELLAAAEESDPEAVEKLRKKWAEQPADVGEERLAWELERSREERTQRWTQASNAYGQYTPQQVQPQIEGVFAELNSRIQAAAQDVVDGKLEPNQVQIDPRGWAELLLPTYQQGQQAALQAANVATQNEVADTLESLPGYRSMTGDERKQFTQAKNTGQIRTMLTVFHDATSRANPENAAKQQDAVNQAAAAAGAALPGAVAKEVAGALPA